MSSIENNDHVELKRYLNALFPEIEFGNESSACSGKILSQGVVLFQEQINFCEPLKSHLEGVTNWSPSLVSGDHNSNFFDNIRNSQSIGLGALADINLAKVVSEKILECFNAYLAIYPFLNKKLSLNEVQIIKYEKGNKFGLHCDEINSCDIASKRRLSVIIYLNDDYEGGETVFPDWELSVKGKQGDILLFPSNYLYPHLSNPVANGIKYVCVAWLSVDN